MLQHRKEATKSSPGPFERMPVSVRLVRVLRRKIRESTPLSNTITATRRARRAASGHATCYWTFRVNGTLTLAPGAEAVTMSV